MSVKLMDEVRCLPVLTRQEADDPYTAPTKLTPAEKSFLIHVADYGDNEGRNIYPYIKHLAERAGKSERQSKVLLRSLKQKGFLVVTEDHTRRSIHYCIPRDGNGIAPRPPVLTEEEIAEAQARKRAAAAKRLQASISYLLQAIDAGEVSEDQWSMLTEHGIGRIQPHEEEPFLDVDFQGEEVDHDLAANCCPAIIPGEVVISEEVDEEQPPAVGSSLPVTLVRGQVMVSEELASSRRPAAVIDLNRWNAHALMPLASGMTPFPSLPTTPLPRVIDASSSPAPREVSASSHENRKPDQYQCIEDVRKAYQDLTLSTLPPVQEIAGWRKFEAGAQGLLLTRFVSNNDSRRKETLARLRDMRARLDLLAENILREECERE